MRPVMVCDVCLSSFPQSRGASSAAELFRCSLCSGFVAPPMMQCRAGHLLCAPCRKSWRCRWSCPTCRGLLKPPMRNTALEQVASTIGLSSESCSADITTAISTHGEELAALFVCPVCFEYVQPPMLQCRAGHLLCNECRPRVSSCPCCRKPLAPKCRNVAMETLAAMVPFPSEPDALGDDFIAAFGGAQTAEQLPAPSTDDLVVQEPRFLSYLRHSGLDDGRSSDPHDVVLLLLSCVLWQLCPLCDADREQLHRWVSLESQLVEQALRLVEGSPDRDDIYLRLREGPTPHSHTKPLYDVVTPALRELRRLLPLDLSLDALSESQDLQLSMASVVVRNLLRYGNPYGGRRVRHLVALRHLRHGQDALPSTSSSVPRVAQAPAPAEGVDAGLLHGLVPELRSPESGGPQEHRGARERQASAQTAPSDVGDKRASLPVVLEPLSASLPSLMPAGALEPSNTEAPTAAANPSRWQRVHSIFARLLAAVSQMRWERREPEETPVEKDPHDEACVTWEASERDTQTSKAIQKRASKCRSELALKQNLSIQSTPQQRLRAGGQ
ncbi:uncharacterized protein LOC136767338 [Amia ocellicauda]|uniref:uncharacterized protein LOC136767338 n=1 Tax=Amia ocellicauda TaxID=2972642 RepID=UPI003464A716